MWLGGHSLKWANCHLSTALGQLVWRLFGSGGFGCRLVGIGGGGRWREAIPRQDNCKRRSMGNYIAGASKEVHSRPRQSSHCIKRPEKRANRQRSRPNTRIGL
jgi:hypothetical protein